MTVAGAEDREACDIYAESVERARAGTISDEALIRELRDFWLAAESDRLIDWADELRRAVEGGEPIPQETVNKIRVWCELD